MAVDLTAVTIAVVIRLARTGAKAAVIALLGVLRIEVSFALAKTADG